jgi:hypothetical protein
MVRRGGRLCREWERVYRVAAKVSSGGLEAKHVGRKGREAGRVGQRRSGAGTSRGRTVHKI